MNLKEFQQARRWVASLGKELDRSGLNNVSGYIYPGDLYLTAQRPYFNKEEFGKYFPKRYCSLQHAEWDLYAACVDNQIFPNAEPLNVKVDVTGGIGADGGGDGAYDLHEAKTFAELAEKLKGYDWDHLISSGPIYNGGHWCEAFEISLTIRNPKYVCEYCDGITLKDEPCDCGYGRESTIGGLLERYVPRDCLQHFRYPHAQHKAHGATEWWTWDGPGKVLYDDVAELLERCAGINSLCPDEPPLSWEAVGKQCLTWAFG